MVEPGEQLGFAGEAAGEAGIMLALRSEDLDGDDAVEGFLPGLVNDAHASAAQAFEDLELRKAVGDFLRRRRRRGPGGIGGIEGARCHGLAHEAGGAEGLR